MSEYLSQEGYQIIGTAFEVYNEQGFGLSEEIYQESMEIELDSRSISFSSKESLQVRYKNHHLQKSLIYAEDGSGNN